MPEQLERVGTQTGGRVFHAWGCTPDFVASRI